MPVADVQNAARGGVVGQRVHLPEQALETAAYCRCLSRASHSAKVRTIFAMGSLNRPAMARAAA